MRPITQEDMPTIIGWFEARGTTVDEKILPLDGYMLDGECAVFIYAVSNAPVLFLEWVVTNPELSARQAVESLDVLAASLADLSKDCKDAGVCVMGILSNEKLVKVFEKHGFKSGCRNEITFAYGG